MPLFLTNCPIASPTNFPAAQAVEKLQEMFPLEIASGALTLINDDIRNFDAMRSDLVAGKYIVAANIPYYITGEIIRQFLTTTVQPRAMALLMQKEVADRIIARDHKESILSLSVKAYGTPKIVANVSRGNFSPPPSVDSAILVITDISRAFFGDLDEKAFFRAVRAGFSSKRKKFAGNLVHSTGLAKPDIIRAFGACGIAQNARAEDVPLEKWRLLVLELASIYRSRADARPNH